MLPDAAGGLLACAARQHATKNVKSEAYVPNTPRPWGTFPFIVTALCFFRQIALWLYVVLQQRKALAVQFVAIGYDNYSNNLREPKLSRTENLINELEKYMIVYKKTLREAKCQKNSDTKKQLNYENKD